MWETNVCCLSHPVSGVPLYQPELPGGLVWSAGGCLLWPITSTGLWGIVGPPTAEVHGPGHSPLIPKSTHTSPSQCLCTPCWGLWELTETLHVSCCLRLIFPATHSCAGCTAVPAQPDAALGSAPSYSIACSPCPPQAPLLRPPLPIFSGSSVLPGCFPHTLF